MLPHHTRAFVESAERDALSTAERRRPLADGAELERLVRAAERGNGAAWSALVERFVDRVRRTARAHRLPAHDVEDVVQTTWLRLLEHIDRVREPRALGGWLETTARHESLRVIRTARRETPTDGELLPTEVVLPSAEQRLVASESRDALADTLTKLPSRECRLLLMLFAEPAPSYVEISRSLELPIGSIGPTRARCLERLRRNRALVNAIGPEA